MKHRRYSILIMFSVIGIMTVFIVLANTNNTHVDPTISEEESHMEEKEISKEESMDFASIFTHDGKEYETTSDEQYIYYLDEDGIPVYAIVKDFQTMRFPNTPSDQIGKKEIEKEATDLFDKVFEKAVQGVGREKEIHVYDFNGNTWLVTVRLLENSLDTGYSASLDYSAEGKLICASFIRGEEQSQGILITKEQALILAREALLADCKKLYGEDVILHFEKERDVSCNYRVWAAKNMHYWEIELFVPTENMGPWDNYELYSLIRIDSQTGECLAIATPLK